MSNQNNAVHDDDDVDITELVPPLPLDVENPTFFELRRMVGYLPLLSQYQYQTIIVTLLKEKPYDLPRALIDRLIHIADIASICRRCCIRPRGILTEEHGLRRCVEFDINIASDIIALANDFSCWYKRHEEGRDEDHDDFDFEED